MASQSLQNPAYYLHDRGKAHIGEAPTPKITDPHDVIIRIAYVGVCGSDVHFWTQGGIGQKVDPSKPLILGHEASGTVHAIGPSIKTLQVNDRVALEPGIPCRCCAACKHGNYNLCPTIRFAAAPPDSHGTLVKYFKIPSDFCYKLPEHISLEEGVLMEPLAVAVHATRLAEIQLGQNVVVFGAGTVGLLCAVVAKAMGAKTVTVVDVNAERLAFARVLGVTGTNMSSTNDTAEMIAANILKENQLPYLGVDVVLEVTGVQSCIEAGILVVRSGGTYVQVGLGKSKIEFPVVIMSEKEIHMRGSYRYGSGDFQLALQLLSTGRVRVKDFISNVVPFEIATEAWEMTRKGIGLKNLIEGPRDEFPPRDRPSQEQMRE